MQLTLIVLLFLSATSCVAKQHRSHQRKAQEIVSARTAMIPESRDSADEETELISSRALANSSDMLKVVSEHNKYRRQEGASNMMEVVYNDYLASMASEWALACDFNHGHPYRVDPPWSWIGQNLYAVSVPKVNFTRAMLSWYAEKSKYLYDKKSCTSGYVCGHYTAMVWWESNNVGCGYAICPVLTSTSFTNAAFIVCNYGPGGNYVGEYPFLKGTACSQCPAGSTCNNGLCKAV